MNSVIQKGNGGDVEEKEGEGEEIDQEEYVQNICEILVFIQIVNLYMLTFEDLTEKEKAAVLELIENRLAKKKKSSFVLKL